MRQAQTAAIAATSVSHTALRDSAMRTDCRIAASDPGDGGQRPYARVTNPASEPFSTWPSQPMYLSTASQDKKPDAPTAARPMTIVAPTAAASIVSAIHARRQRRY